MEIRWGASTGSETEIQKYKKFIQDRQISRLYVVASSEVTAPVIEALDEADRAAVDHLLVGTGCEALFVTSGGG